MDGAVAVPDPQPCRDLGEREVRALPDTGARLPVPANPGRPTRVAAAARRLGTPIAVAHTAQVLDASLRGLSANELL